MSDTDGTWGGLAATWSELGDSWETVDDLGPLLERAGRGRSRYFPPGRARKICGSGSVRYLTL